MLNELNIEFSEEFTSEFKRKLMKAICEEFGLEYDDDIDEQIVREEGEWEEINFKIDMEWSEIVDCMIDFDCDLIKSENPYVCMKLFEFISSLDWV